MAIKNEVQASVRSWSQEVSERSTQMVGDLLQHQGQHLSVVGGVLESTAELLDAVISAARDNIQSQAEAFAQAKQKATSAADAELGRLRTQNELLSRLLAEERARTSTLRTDLITGISDMIVGFTEKQDASLSAAVSKVQAGNERGLEEIGQFASEHAAVVDDAMQSASAFSHVLEARSADVEKQRGKGAEVSFQLGIAADNRHCRKLHLACVADLAIMHSRLSPRRKSMSRLSTPSASASAVLHPSVSWNYCGGLTLSVC